MIIKFFGEYVLKIYGEVKKTLTEYQIEFALIQQEEKTYTKPSLRVKSLAGKVCPELTDSQKANLLSEAAFKLIFNAFFKCEHFLDSKLKIY